MTCRVLVAEDDPDIVELYRTALPIHDIELVAVARNGEEAVAKYQQLRGQVDLVMLDHRMPVMTGLDAAKRIIESDPGVRIVLTTADESVEQECAKLGISAFKRKPTSLQRLVDNIWKHGCRSLTR